MSAPDLRIWNPVLLGGGVYRVFVVSWGSTLCSVRLEDDCVRADGSIDTAHRRPWVARVEELHTPENWQAKQGEPA